MNLKRVAFVSLRVLMGHPLRTFLSCLAVSIGVAAVVMMVGAGKAAQKDTMKKIKNMGTDLVTIQAGRFKNVGGRARQVQRFTTLTPKDVRTLKLKVDNIKNIAGVYDRRTTVIYGDIRTRTLILGVEPSAFQIWRLESKMGQLYNDMDEKKISRVCVLGPTAYKNLFLNQNPVGETIRINNVPFKVIGVSGERGQDVSGEDLDDAIYVPLQSAMKRIFYVNFLDSILLQLKNFSQKDDTIEEITKILRKNHKLREGKEDDFTIQDQSQLLEAELQTAKAFTYLVGVVAGMSMLTGGIGILAVMMISLKERKREVGLRRAVGAKHRDILIQFLLEASILSTLGGIIGVIIGLVGCKLICYFSKWEAVMPFTTALWAFGLAFLVGIVFGLYPARAASKLQPIEAMRAVV
ncbi:MAG: ABC transporter permease [Thermoanaerobaculia bacterium]